MIDPRVRALARIHTNLPAEIQELMRKHIMSKYNKLIQSIMHM